jgi:phosphomannomutase
MKVFVQGQVYYEALADNPDVRRDYDYRATNEGGRDFSPKNMAYYIWSWIQMAEDKCNDQGLDNNKTILITHDCRYYPEEIIEAAREAARRRGYQVVFAYASGTYPSCVSSYSHAVRVVRPVLAVFITASHVSRPAENTIVGAKVSILGNTGQLESISTHDIKVITPGILKALKERDDLHRIMNNGPEPQTIEVGNSHTDLMVLGALTALGKIPGKTVFSLGEELKDAREIEKTISSYLAGARKEADHIFKGIKVVIEGAHTSSGPLAREAFSALGAEAFLLHGEVEAVRGEHTADPSIKQNLVSLYREMEEREAHMGIAFDLDGDRGAIVLRTEEDEFMDLPPDKIGQLLIPFLMDAGGYKEADKSLYIRDCLSTDAILDQAVKSGVTVETTDAGYVFLKKREKERLAEGYTTLGMGEASGHAWLHYTGPFENPIAVATFFTVMSAGLCKKKGLEDSRGTLPYYAFSKALEESVIPYKKAPRFQPLFTPALIARAAAKEENTTGWTPDSKDPMPQLIIKLCRSESVSMLEDKFKPGVSFGTKIGTLTVEKFESQWDEEEKIYRFGKIYFSLDGVPVGSFVSRASSNDPTAVQVWEAREFGSKEYNGIRLSDEELGKRFDLIGGLVLDACESMGILTLTDKKPARNMEEVLPSVQRFREQGFLL